jgi:hypothetical protein
MKSPIDERLQAEYKHPLRYLSEAEYRQYRNNYFREAVFTIGAGLLLVFTMILLNTGSYTSPPMQNQQDLLTVFFAGVVVFGLYRLLTIRRSVIQGRRDQLASEYPELRPKTTKKPFITASSAKVSPIIYYAWAALGITILAMIVAYLFI